MLTPAGRFAAVAAAVLIVAGIALGYPELLGVAAALTVAVAAGLATGRFSGSLDIERTVQPTAVAVGEPATVQLTVTNGSARRRRGVTAVDRSPAGLVPVRIPALAAGTSATESYPLAGQRRGLWPVGPLLVGRADPLHLVRGGNEWGPTTTLVVYPRVYPVVPLPVGRSRDLDGPTSAEAPEGGVAFHTLRQYVAGDDRRLIHWRSSARTGTLLVRRNVDATQPRTLVLVDTRAERYDDADSFEAALSAAASLATACHRGGFPVALTTTASGGAPRGDLLATLAALQLGTGRPLGEVLGTRANDLRGWGLVVLSGRLGAEDLVAVSQYRNRFDAVVTASFTRRPGRGSGRTASSRSPSDRGAGAEGSRGGGVGLATGAVHLAVHSGEDFAQAWNAAMR